MRRVDSLEETDAGRDWGQEEKGTTEDEMAGWHHRLYGHEFEWTPRVGDGQGSLVCCDSWGREESDTTERLNWTEHMLEAYQVELVVKNLPAIACRHKRHQYDLWSGRSLGGGHGKPFQYSYLKNRTDRGACWAMVHRVAKSPTWLKWLSMHVHTCTSLHSTWLSMYPISIIFLFMMIWSHYSAVCKYSDLGCYYQVSLNFFHDHLGINF